MTQKRRTLYPEIEPYASGMLDVGDGHSLYWERCGTPGAKPAVFLHGGPGAGISPNHRRQFDPAKYDVLLFDQRGAGKSTPHANLDANTTWHLVDDIERLREMCGVDKWMVFGGSWGSTLSASPMRRPIPSASPNWCCAASSCSARASSTGSTRYGASELYPEGWDDFVAPVPKDERGDLVGAYRRLLTCDDRRDAAARRQGVEQVGGADRHPAARPRNDRAEFTEDQHAIAIARIENHYMAQQGLARGRPAARRAPRSCAASPASSSRAATTAAPRRAPPGS